MAESKGLSGSPIDEDPEDPQNQDENPDEPGTVGAGSVDESGPVNEIDPVDGPPSSESPTSYRLRRAPRYRAFGITGVVLGIIVGLVLATSFDASDDYSTQTILGYFIAIFGLLGALIGCGAAVLIDRRRR